MGTVKLNGSLEGFTDRISQTDTFMDVYVNEYVGHFKDPEYQKATKVINYYGAGGAGKSSLLQKLLEDLEAYIGNKKCPAYAFYDFESNKFEVCDILAALVKNIKDHYGRAFQFKRFEEAYRIYDEKQKSNKIGAEDRFLSNNVGVKVVNEFLSGISAGSMLVAFDVISSVGKSFSKFRKELQNADVNTLLCNMPSYFVEDMKENMAEADFPFVIFLDTYEKYINTAVSPEDETLGDRWLYQMKSPFGEGILHQIPDVLWVIAGREKMRWGAAAENWLKAVPVDNFNYDYTMEYLDKFNITDPELREHIFETTKGNPFYLRICAAIYEDLTARQIKVLPEYFDPDSQGSREVLVERFVRYLGNEQQEEMAYRLSCFDSWDEQLLDYVIQKELGVETVLNKLRKFSFITMNKVQDGNGVEYERYHMHQTMRNVLHTVCAPEIKKEMHQKIREYYADYLVKNDTFSFDFENGLRVFMIDCLENLSYSDCLEAFQNTILPAFDKFWIVLKQQVAHSIAEDFLRRITEAYPETVLHAQCLILYADCTYKLGNIIDSKSYLDQAIRILDQNGLQDSLITLKAMERMIPYYRYFKDLSTAVDIAKNIYEQLQKLLTDKHPDTLYAEMKYAIILRNKEKNIDGTLLSIKHLTNVYQGLSECYPAGAPKLIEAHLELLNAKRFMPEADFAELASETEQVYNECLTVIGEDRSLTIRAKSLTALYASLNKDYALAISRQREIVHFFQKNLGQKHTITINALSDLAYYYKQSGKEKEYEKIMNSIPEDDLMEQDRWFILFHKAENYIKNHQIDMAKETYTLLLDEIRSNLQDGYAEVYNYTDKLIQRLCSAEYYDEALELFKTISHYDTADDTLVKIMRVCDNKNSQYDKLEELCGKLEALIDEFSSGKENSLIFWQCRQHLSNIMLRAHMDARAYQLRQELWNYDLTEGLKDHKYAEVFRKHLYRLKGLKGKNIDFNVKINTYQAMYNLLKSKILQGCNRHKLAYTVLNNMAEEYKAAGMPNEYLMKKILLYNIAFNVFGPNNKTSRYILSEMQRLVYQEGWYDWCNYLKTKKSIDEPVNFIQCKVCSRIRPITIEECNCSKEV